MPATKIFSHFIWRCAGVRSLQILTMMMDDEWDEDWTEDVISCLTASEDLQNMSTISVTSGDKESDRHGEVTVDAGEAISNGTSNGSDDSGDFTVEAGAAGARERVYADGNCFFKSAALHIRSQDDTALRQSLCNHIAENIHSYWGFFPNCSSPDEALQQIIAIRGSGIWDTAVNDVLPLALANFTGRRIKIFTSKQDPDVINVKLTMCNGDVFQPIYLAYLAPSGLPEHYDGCIAKKRHLYTLFGTTQHVVEESECHESSSGTFSFHSSGTTQINVLVEEQPQPDVRPEDNERNTPPHHSTSSSMQGHAEMSTCQTPPHPDNCTSEETTPRPVQFKCVSGSSSELSVLDMPSYSMHWTTAEMGSSVEKTEEPKKDQCLLCTRYHDATRSSSLTASLEKEYQEHQERKREGREEKANDKKMSQENDGMHCAAFDLESVLPTPCSLVSQTHYKR
ncbi:hypothetical protein BaRGS_00003935, partial [Batillaria attramentaria]